MIGWLAVGWTSAAKPQPSRRFFRNPTWSWMPSPVRLTEAIRTESSSVLTRASERSRTAASIITTFYDGGGDAIRRQGGDRDGRGIGDRRGNGAPLLARGSERGAHRRPPAQYREGGARPAAGTHHDTGCGRIRLARD